MSNPGDSDGNSKQQTLTFEYLPNTDGMDASVAYLTGEKTIELQPGNIQLVNENGDIVYYNIVNQDLLQQTAPSTISKPQTIDQHISTEHQVIPTQMNLTFPVNKKDTQKEIGQQQAWSGGLFVQEKQPDGQAEMAHKTPEDDPSKLHVCSKCNASFATSSYLKAHLKRKCIRAKNINNPLQCEHCPLSFKMKFQLNRHMMLHTGERPFRCDKCPKTFLTKSHLKRHAVIHVPKEELEHKCDRCDKVFAWGSALESHMKSHTGEKRFKCGICGRMFLHLNSLRGHMTNRHTVNGKFTCVVCKQCFSKATDLILHMKTHSEQQSVKCERCFALFTSLNDLETHICTNFGGKPLICVICNYECQDSSEYCNHACMQNNANRRCGCCSKTFKSLWHLREHLITHTGEKPFKCSLCLNSFRRKRELEIHLTRHSSEKTFKCDKCSQMFTSANYLKQHQRNEHREKKFICDVCGHAFMHKCALTNHMSFHEKTGNKKFGKKYHRDNEMLVKELVERRLARENNSEGDDRQVNKANEQQMSETNIDHVNDGKTNETNEAVGIVSSNVITEINEKEIEARSSMDHEVSENMNIPMDSISSNENQTEIMETSNSVTPTGELNTIVSSTTSTTKGDEQQQLDDFTRSVIKPRNPIRNAEQDPSNITTIYETHSNGDITIRCASCFQEFRSQGDLLRHRKESHDDGKPYQCDFCSRTFSVAASLSQHRSIHNVKRKYSCNKCGKSYKITHKLREHLRVKHYENTDELTDLELQLRSCPNGKTEVDNEALNISEQGNVIGVEDNHFGTTLTDTNPQDLGIKNMYLSTIGIGNTAVQPHTAGQPHNQTISILQGSDQPTISVLQNSDQQQTPALNILQQNPDQQQQQQTTISILQHGYGPSEIQPMSTHQTTENDNMIDVVSAKNVLSNIVFINANGTTSAGLSTEQLQKRGDVAFLMNLSSLITELGDNIGNQRIIIQEGLQQVPDNHIETS